MAKINIARGDGDKNVLDFMESRLKLLVEELLGQYEELYKAPEGLPKKVAQYLKDEFFESLVVDVSLSDSGFSIDIPELMSCRRFIQLDRNRLIHDFFELNPRYQGKNIAPSVMQASLDIADELNLNTISLHANLDVGGYAWLRKGALPFGGEYFDGSVDIRQLYEDILLDDWINADNAVHRKMVHDFLDELEGLAPTPKAHREYFTSPKFRKYKEIFLGTEWEGAFDITDPLVRNALVKGAKPAHDLVKAAPTMRTTINEKIHDELLQRHHFVMMYAEQLTEDAMELLSVVNKEIRSDVLAAIMDLAGTRLSDKNTLERLAELDKTIQNAFEPAFDKIYAATIDQAGQFAAVEAAATASIIEGAIPAVLNLKLPSSRTLNRIAKATPFEGRTLAEWLSRQEGATIDQFVQQIKTGISRGETAQQIRSRIYNDGSIDSALYRTRQQLDSLIRTVVNGIQNEVRQEVYKENADDIGANEEYFSATLDSRTTMECAKFDGTRHKIGKGPQPPLHFGCRSIRLLYINPELWTTRGFDSYSEGQFLDDFAEKNNLNHIKKVSDLPHGLKGKYDSYVRQRRRDLVGTVPAQRTYAQWFSHQNETFQRDYLGADRFELYKSGKISFKNFTDSKGQLLTIEQLQQKIKQKENKGAITKPKAEPKPEPVVYKPIDFENDPFVNSAPPLLTKAETSAVRAYTARDYVKMNKLMRKQGYDPYKEDDFTTERNRQLMSAIDKLEIPYDVELYRGIVVSKELAAQYEVGGIIHDKGFTSTSMSRESISLFNHATPSKKGIALTIRAPKGTKGLPADPFSSYGDEHEIILKGSALKILEMKEEGSIIHIIADLIGDRDYVQQK